MAKELYISELSKEDLLSSKSEVDAEITVLSTKKGADDFIALETSKIDLALSKMPSSEKPLGYNQVSMKTFLSALKMRVQSNPNSVVSEKLTSLEQRATELSVAISSYVEPIEEEKP